MLARDGPVCEVAPVQGAEPAVPRCDHLVERAGAIGPGREGPRVAAACVEVQEEPLLPEGNTDSILCAEGVGRGDVGIACRLTVGAPGGAEPLFDGTLAGVVMQVGVVRGLHEAGSWAPLVTASGNW